MASVNWLGTLNNPDTTTVEQYLKGWFDDGASYVNGQLEKGKEGTVHINSSSITKNLVEDLQR